MAHLNLARPMRELRRHSPKDPKIACSNSCIREFWSIWMQRVTKGFPRCSRRKWPRVLLKAMAWPSGANLEYNLQKGRGRSSQHRKPCCNRFSRALIVAIKQNSSKLLINLYLLRSREKTFPTRSWNSISKSTL